MSARTIKGKLDRLARNIREQQPANLTTCWGNEIPRELPPGTVHIKTSWGTVRV